MTEANERITALETNMSYVLGILAKREEYQNSVLKSLTIIEMKQDQALTYQKTCDAERTAYGTRIGRVEDDMKASLGFRRLLRTQAVVISGAAAFLVTLLTAYTFFRHGL